MRYGRLQRRLAVLPQLQGIEGHRIGHHIGIQAHLLPGIEITEGLPQRRSLPLLGILTGHQQHQQRQVGQHQNQQRQIGDLLKDPQAMAKFFEQPQIKDMLQQLMKGR